MNVIGNRSPFRATYQIQKLSIMLIIQIFKENFRLNASALENIFHRFFVLWKSEKRDLMEKSFSWLISSIIVNVCWLQLTFTRWLIALILTVSSTIKLKQFIIHWMTVTFLRFEQKSICHITWSIIPMSKHANE